MRQIATTEYVTDLQGTRFASEPLEVHEAVLCALAAIGSADSIPSNATDGQRLESAAMRPRISPLLDDLHPLLAPLSGPKWRRVSDDDALAESYASLLVLRATHDLWSDRYGEEVLALRRALMEHRKIMRPSPAERQRWLGCSYKTANGWRGPQGEIELSEAAASVFSGADAERMSGAVGHLVGAYLYAGADGQALERAYEWCAFFYDGQAPAFRAPRQAAVPLGPRSRLSPLATA